MIFKYLCQECNIYMVNYKLSYVRTNRNHKQTYEFLIQAAHIWLVHSNTKNQDSPLYPNDPPLMTFLSSNLKNEQILFSVY